MKQFILLLAAAAMGAFLAVSFMGAKTDNTTVSTVSANDAAQNDHKADVNRDTSAKHTFSELFTDDQLNEIARTLGIPDDLEVSVEVGNSYWWDGAGIELAQVDFYHNGVYCAGAECQVHSSNVAKGIYSYEQ